MEALVLKISWFHLATLRFMLCLSPQYGYVYPDEFFQSTEVMAGDIFNFSHFRSWEWNAEKPIRNIVFPALSSGLPFILVKLLSNIIDFHIGPILLLLVPRLWMTLQSFAIDIIIYNLTIKLYQSQVIAYTASTLFASSYVCWIYFTRTFSNCTETVLYGILLYLVITDHNSIKYLFSSRCKSTNTTGVGALVLHDSKNSITFLISIVFVSGFFLRISFAVFAFVPIVFWVVKTLPKQNCFHSILYLLKTVFHLALGGFCTAIIFVFCDTAYFNYEKILQISDLLQNCSVHKIFYWLKSLPLTPLNSLMYNTDADNWAKHGIHPYFLHLTVNLPLLFSPFVFTLAPGIFYKNYFDNLHTLKCQINKTFFLLFCSSFTFSLLILSCVGHQEPRFLLPLIIPFTVVYSRCFHPVLSHKILVFMWILFNVILYVFYGLVHQGGVVPTMNFLNSIAKAHHREVLSNRTSNVSIIFYKTYMPPIHLAASPFLGSSNTFLIKDMAGKPFLHLQKTINASFVNHYSEVYLVVPSNLPCVQFEILQKVYILDEKLTIFPHFSTEIPPWADNICNNIDININIFDKFAQRMLLIVFKVSKYTSVENISVYLPLVMHSSAF